MKIIRMKHDVKKVPVSWGANTTVTQVSQDLNAEWGSGMEGYGS